MENKIKIDLDGKSVIIETGKIAKQADGACTVQLGGTIVLVTACAAKKGKDGADFFPLTVEYQERTYAAGKIPGGFFKREGKPRDKEILTSRLIDRPMRPLFPEGMTNEVQIIALVLSSDSQNDSDVLAMLGASTALSLSNIPFDGPVASLRVGRVEGKFIVNPTFQDMEKSDLDLIVSGKKDKILMIESGSEELQESDMADALAFAKKYFAALIDAQTELMSKSGNAKRPDMTFMRAPDALVEEIKKLSGDKLKKAILVLSKHDRQDGIDAISDEMIKKFVTDETGYSEQDVKLSMSKLEEFYVRDYMFSSGKRVDNRAYTEIRHIECQTGLLPRTHGSGLFTRGQTQSLSVTTLGTSLDEQIIDALEGEYQKSFMLHYNFPPFSVGETKPMRGTGRREIGHGTLAERAIKPVLPSKDDFPYTIRVVSDILESNGSSSMATVCAGTLSLMDAGVPIKAPVAGIAMGIITDGNKEIILTDIAGVEDHYGDMDFKVAGTSKGITAVQLDMKVTGVSFDVIGKALAQAKDARLKILDIMTKVIAAPKAELSEYAPKIITFKIDVDKIREVIGQGGKVIKKIIQDTGVTINIEDDGSVQIASNDSAAMKMAIDIVQGIVAEPEVGRIYTGTITRLMNFGAFCEFLPGKEGLIHVSEIADKFVKNVADAVKVGDEVQVKLIQVDEQRRVNLSIKQALIKTDPGVEKK